MSRRGLAIAVGALAWVALVACSEGDEEGRDDPVSSETIPASAPTDGELLCDFVPRDSVVLALGRDEFEVTRGEVLREPKGALQGASCALAPTGTDYEMLTVDVAHPMGYVGSVFEDALADTERYAQLPEEIGVGVYQKDPIGRRPGGEKGPVGFAQLSRGNWLVSVYIVLPADGRDSSADAVALVQQVVDTLEISDEWTLRGDPPSWFTDNSA